MNEQKGERVSKSRIICWVIFALIFGFAAVVLIPNQGKPYPSSPADVCINNLRQIEVAANEFALEHGKTNGEAINFPDDLTPYIKLNSAGKIPSCPQGGTYQMNKIGETPTCSLGANIAPAHVLP